ncbi:MAG: transposase, partial [SAR324 cluster bacterium]|nr:transposase [SAR324 cluster bacterium]
ECIRPKTPLSLEDARSEVEKYVDHYNIERLHSAIDYIAPLDKLNGREQEIFVERKRKLVKARKHRKWRYEVQRPSDILKPGDWNPVDATLEIEEAVVVG